MALNVNEPRITGPVLKVLDALMSSSRAKLSGSEIARVTGLASGTLYPILFRLERAGWLSSHWEEEDPQVLRRPRRRLYWVTALGACNAEASVKDLGVAFGKIVSAWGR